MSSNDHRLVQCNEKDRETLLIFKKGIIDPLGRISTWSIENEDCCAWKGVHCDNITRRVTKLDLNFNFLKGEINLCILQLEFLSNLDLSSNKFNVIRIPSIQHNITHSSNLIFLDLSFNFGGAGHKTQLDSLHWLSPLFSLKYLNLSGIDLHEETNWLQEVNTLSSLLELHLWGCKLNNFTINPFMQYLNLSSLVTLDLSFNNLTSQLPNEFFNLTKDVTYLNLSSNHIHGEIPSSLLNLQNLRHLDLAYNQLKGLIPDQIGQLAYLQYLDLSINMLSSLNPSSLGNLSSLYYLSIGSNNFSCEISEKAFSKLSNLDSLELGKLNFVFQFDLKWVPPFQFSRLFMDNTNLGPNFPSWIYTQKSLVVLDLSSSGILLININKLSSLIERIPCLYLPNNSMNADISNLTLKNYNLELGHNNFTGGLPNISPMTFSVDLFYNSFSGSIPQSWMNLEDLFHINLWNNRLSGEVPRNFFDLRHLEVINLGKNNFYGTIYTKQDV